MKQKQYTFAEYLLNKNNVATRKAKNIVLIGMRGKVTKARKELIKLNAQKMNIQHTWQVIDYEIHGE